jgi:hypothetical protein
VIRLVLLMHVLDCVDLQTWAADTLTRLAGGHRIPTLGELMPWAYAARGV